MANQPPPRLADWNLKLSPPDTHPAVDTEDDFDSQYKKNRTLVYEYDDQIEIPESPPPPIWTPSKTHWPTLRTSDGWVYSQYDPPAAPDSWIRSHNFTPYSVIVIWGIGLGYGLPALPWADPSIRHVFVVEADPRRFQAALSLINWQPMVQSQKLRLWIGKSHDSWQTALRHQYFLDIAYGWTTVRIPRCQEPNTAIYNRFNATLHTIMDLRHTAWTVNWHSDHDRYLQLLANLPTWLTWPPICRMFDTVSYPIIVIGPGPSLDRELTQLAEIRPLVYIIALDTAFPALIASGLRPDMVVAVDFTSGNCIHFDGLWSDTQGVWLAADPSVSPDLLTRYRGPITWTNPNIPLLNALLANDESIISRGLSVAATAIDIALKMGTGPVALLGLDFGYQPSQAYSNAARKKTIITQKNNCYYKISGTKATPLREILGTTGLVLVDAVMTQYREVIESNLAAYHQSAPHADAIINLSAAGTCIHHTVFRPLSNWKLTLSPTVKHPPVNPPSHWITDTTRTTLSAWISAAEDVQIWSQAGHDALLSPLTPTAMAAINFQIQAIETSIIGDMLLWMMSHTYFLINQAKVQAQPLQIPEKIALWQRFFADTLYWSTQISHYLRSCQSVS